MLNHNLGAFINDVTPIWRFSDHPTPLSHAFAINLMYLCHKETNLPPTYMRVVFYEWSFTQFTILKVRNTFLIHKAMKRGSSHVYIITEMYSLMFKKYFNNKKLSWSNWAFWNSPFNVCIIFIFVFLYFS